MRLHLEAVAPPDLPWIETRAGCCLTSRAKGMKAVDAAGCIRGMVAYDDFTPNSCVVHQAADTPIAWRRLIPACFIYPFEQLGLALVVGTVPANNERALRMTRRLGFREAHRLKDAWAPGVDMVMHELRRADCVRLGWLQPKEQVA